MMKVAAVAAWLFLSASTLAANPPTTEPRPELISRVYDIRDLIMALPDYPYAGTIGVPPDGGPLNIATAEPERPVPTTQRSRKQRVEDVIQLIQETVDPESWRDNGGTIGSLREIGGALVVTQTAQNHDLLSRIFGQLRENAGVIRVQADWVVLNPDQVPALLAPPAKGAESPKIVKREVLDSLARQSTHYRGEISCFSGQLVSLASGRTRSVIYNQEAVVAQKAVAMSPRVKQVTDGLMLEVAPTVLMSSNLAILEVKTKVAQWTAPTSTRAATRPAAYSSIISNAGELDRLNVATQELKTMLRVPLDQPVLVGGMTLDPSLDQPQGAQLYLILQVSDGGQRSEK
jgi:hypothetical protein